MDIEEFYDADPRRRASGEVELGREWRDAHGVRYELNWVEDTGELYVMREPIPAGLADPFGGLYVEDEPIDGLTVTVVARIDSHDQLEDVLDGWPEAMARADGVSWLARRLAERDVAVSPERGVPPVL